jgi:hypothetical protein
MRKREQYKTSIVETTLAAVADRAAADQLARAIAARFYRQTFVHTDTETGAITVRTIEDVHESLRQRISAFVVGWQSRAPCNGA